MKRTALRLGIGAMALLLVGACKDDEKASAQSADINEQAAVQSTQSTIAMANALMDQNDGATAAQSMATIGLGYQNVILADDGSGAYQIAPNAEPVPDLAVVRHALDEAGMTGTCECDETAQSCSFQDCGDTAGTVKMNGSLSWGDGKLACDLTMSGNIEGMTYDITLKSNLTVTETSLDGSIDVTLAIDVTAEGADSSVDVESHVKFNAVTWDAANQPTGGSIDVSASMSVKSGNDSASYEGSANIDLS